MAIPTSANRTSAFRLGALLLGLGLTATACGAGTAGSTSSEFGATVGASDLANEAADDTADGATTNQGDAEEITSESSSNEVEVAGPAAPVPEHLFPDVNVVDLETGATLNIAEELAGGDLPVLLWFWAPH